MVWAVDGSEPSRPRRINTRQQRFYQRSIVEQDSLGRAVSLREYTDHRALKPIETSEHQKVIIKLLVQMWQPTKVEVTEDKVLTLIPSNKQHVQEPKLNNVVVNRFATNMAWRQDYSPCR